MDKFLVNNLMTDSWTWPSLIRPLELPAISAGNIRADVLRLDTIHPIVSGNKWFKLKGHLQIAVERSASSILTFGGAWSNHIIAAAYATQQMGIPAIGMIRGERPPVLSATLEEAAACGMQLEFISRKEYASLTAGSDHLSDPGGPDNDNTLFYRHLLHRYPGVYIIPEGGAGNPGIEACKHILRDAPATGYSHILCAIGTGTMFLGLTAAATPEQEILGFPVLKGISDLSGLSAAPISFDGNHPGFLNPSRHRIIPGYHFGGYACHPPELLAFIRRFYQDTGIPLDIVYTGKLFYAALDMIRKHLFPAHSRLLIIHSGGLQGNQSLPPGSLGF